MDSVFETNPFPPSTYPHLEDMNGLPLDLEQHQDIDISSPFIVPSTSLPLRAPYIENIISPNDHISPSLLFNHQHHHYQEPVATSTIIKTLKLTVHQSHINPDNIYYQICVENHNNELLPEYITHLPGKGLSLSNSHAKQRIFVEQIFNDNKDTRNQLIYKYIAEMTSYHEKIQREQCMVMPLIGKICDKKKKNIIKDDDDGDNEEEEININHNNRKRIRNQDNYNNKQIKTETDRPKKKRKLSDCIDLTTSLSSQSLVDNNDNKENVNEMELDWDEYGKQAKREQIDRLKENLLTCLSIKIESDQCSHCNSRFSGECGDGKWYKNGDMTLCERCYNHQKNGIPSSNNNDDYEGMIICHLIKKQEQEKEEQYGRGKRNRNKNKRKRNTKKNKEDGEGGKDKEDEIDEEDDDKDGDWTPKTSIKSTRKSGKKGGKKGGKTGGKKGGKKGGKMKRRKKEKQESDDDDTEYALKSIHGRIRIKSNKKSFYLAEWDDFDLSMSTWEPMENFTDVTIHEFDKRIEKNGNTVCEQHRGYTVVPCFKCINNNNSGLKDLSSYGINYFAKRAWFPSSHSA